MHIKKEELFEMLTADSKLLTWEELREIQSKDNFCLPSDYVFLGINYNELGIKHSDDILVEIELKNGNRIDFDGGFEIRSLKDEISILEMYDETDGLSLANDYLPFIQTGSRALFLIGKREINLNQIYFFSHIFDSETNLNYTLSKQANNFIEFLTQRIVLVSQDA